MSKLIVLIIKFVCALKFADQKPISMHIYNKKQNNTKKNLLKIYWKKNMRVKIFVTIFFLKKIKRYSFRDYIFYYKYWQMKWNKNAHTHVHPLKIIKNLNV